MHNSPPLNWRLTSEWLMWLTVLQWLDQVIPMWPTDAFVPQLIVLLLLIGIMVLFRVIRHWPTSATTQSVMPNGPPTRAGQPKYIFTRRLRRLLVSHPPTRIAMSVLWSKYLNRTHLLTLYAIRPPKQNSTYNGTPQQAINMRLQLELCVLLLCYQLLHNMRQVLCDFWCFPYVT